jgi:hypothetical protein
MPCQHFAPRVRHGAGRINATRRARHVDAARRAEARERLADLRRRNHDWLVVTVLGVDDADPDDSPAALAVDVSLAATTALPDADDAWPALAELVVVVLLAVPVAAVPTSAVNLLEVASAASPPEAICT